MKKRIITVFVIALALISALALSVSAEEKYSSWQWADEATLVRTDSDGAEYIYTEIDLPIGFTPSYISSAASYSYYYFVDSPEGPYYRIFSGERDAEWLFYQDDDGNVRLFATYEGKADILNYFHGSLDEGMIYLSSNPKRIEAKIDGELLSKLAAPGEGQVSFTLSELQPSELARVVSTDRYSLITHDMGIIYELDYALYYVNLDTLPNNYFDSDGNLSYRQGKLELELTPLGEELSNEVLNIWRETSLRIETDYYYEDDGETIFFDGFSLTEGQATAILITAVALIGVALPVLPLVASIKRIKSKAEDVKLPYALMLGGAAVWMLSGIIVIILILV